ncbi:MAG TPA: ABC transporter substrate-binding protein [Candidatus Limnocylindrales bacterium]|nr:ABC transporter substrate-binding protein [Candidatus Limnocylindrales bacterium]
MRSLRTAAAALAVVAITLSACSSAATTAPTVAPTVAPSAAPSVAATPAGSTAPASTAPTPAPSSAIIPIPSGGVLTFAGKLVICSDIPYPPLEYFDPNGNPIGSDIEIGQEIAKRLGLTAEIQNSVFDTIIPALIGNKCDIIISDQNITADRVKQVDMIPYFQAGQSFVVAVGNPAGINTTDDLCGKKVGAETGTTEVDYLTKTLSPACTKKGLAAITSKTFGKDSDALLALQSGQVDAYFADTPPAAYYTIQHPDQFVLAPIAPLAPAFAGISVLKSNTGLRDAIQQALVAMANDGTYLAILKKYAVDSGALTVSDMMTVNKIQ